MAVELAPRNIQVSAIAPRWIETDMTAPVRTSRDANLQRRNLARTRPGAGDNLTRSPGRPCFWPPRVAVRHRRNHPGGWRLRHSLSPCRTSGLYQLEGPWWRSDNRRFNGSRENATRTLGEEIANSISHGVGLLAALVAAPFLIVSRPTGGTAAVVGRGRIRGHGRAALRRRPAVSRASRPRARSASSASSTTARSSCSSRGPTRRSPSACCAGGWGWTLLGVGLDASPRQASSPRR